LAASRSGAAAQAVMKEAWWRFRRDARWSAS